MLSYGSDAQALSDQDTMIDQGVTADATADSTQDSVIGQGTGTDAGTAADPQHAAATDRPRPISAAPYLPALFLPTAPVSCPMAPPRTWAALPVPMPPAPRVPSTATCSTST